MTEPDDKAFNEVLKIVEARVYAEDWLVRALTKTTRMAEAEVRSLLHQWQFAVTKDIAQAVVLRGRGSGG